MEPRIQYAKTSDGIDIAYYVIGQGPPLVRAATPPFSHLSAAWQLSWIRADTESLAESFQVVSYDTRGTGLSQRQPLDFSLEARLLDINAVVEKVRLERFALNGSDHGTPVAIGYAACYPERVTHLILHAPYARGAQYYELPEFRFTAALSDEMVKEQWEFATLAWANRLTSDPVRAAGLARLMRAAMTPQAMLAFREAARRVDVSGLLPKIVAPTLVRYGEGYQPAFSREIAAAIPNARLVVTQPNEPVVPVIMEFLLGGAKAEPAGRPGGLVTILFTDLTSSTALTQRLGDAKAQELVRAHNVIVREALTAHHGSEIKHTGDGIMASFTTASGALECAVAIQRAVEEQRVGAHGHAPLQVHIGLNAGEPAAEEQDLFGTAVQLARRICDAAEGGEILASDVVRQLAAGKGFLFADRGEVALRGFEDPVRLYEVRWRADS